MKEKSIQTKRGAGKKSGLKILHARTAGRRKQRAVASTSADLGGDVPNVGIGRALLVILVLHVVAIGAVIMHTSWTDGQGGESFTSKSPAVVADDEVTEKVEEAPKEKPKQKVKPVVNEAPKAVVVVPPVEPAHSIIPHEVIKASNKPPAPKQEEVVKAVVVKPASSNTQVYEYTVKSGDSVWAICNKYKMSQEKFREINNINKNVIRVGQKVLVTR